VHEAHDEVFHVLDDVLFGPRRVPHAFASVSPTARLVLTFQPALTIEAFFGEGGLEPSSDEFARVSRAHGMGLIAPPLDLGQASGEEEVRPRGCGISAAFLLS
jgi:hypothetical protein